MMSRRTAGLAIAAAVVIGLVVRLHAWVGMIASDDLTHVYAAAHFWDDPIEHSMPTEDDSAYTVNTRRAGVNLLQAIAIAVGGVNERALSSVSLVASALTIVLCGLWAGALAGRRAAVVAAWLVAATPVDAWQATIWLQDNVYAALICGAMAAMAWGVRTGRLRWWFVAGLAFGYLQYVKENASILVSVLVVVGAVRSWRARRIDRPTVALLGGVAAMQVVACAYWSIAMGDPLYYVRAWLARQTAVESQESLRPYPHNLVRLGLYAGYHLTFGIGLLLAIGPGVKWLRRGDAPARVRTDLAIVAGLQLVLLVHVMRWGAWTQRYLLQITPYLAAIGAAGLVWTTREWKPRARTALLAGAVALTALGLAIGRQQHGPYRADVVRAFHRALPGLAPPDAPVVVVRNPARPAHYTDRALAILDGYRHDRFGNVLHPGHVARGLVVYCHLERLPRPTAPPGRRVFAHETRGGREWIEVYAVGLP